MATSRMTAIKAIDKRTKLHSINVRILRKWNQNERFGKSSTEMILADEEVILFIIFLIFQNY